MKDQLTIIIKTFERPLMLRRLLASIKQRYPELSVLVADDSKRPYADSVVRSMGMSRTVRVFRMLYDSGLSAGRNLLVRNVQTPWYVLADDDFVIEDYTNLEYGLQVAQTHDLDIVAGQHIRSGKPFGWSARFHRLGSGEGKGDILLFNLPRPPAWGGRKGDGFIMTLRICVGRKKGGSHLVFDIWQDPK